MFPSAEVIVRTIGFALVSLSLLVSAGGVSADATETAAADEQAAQCAAPRAPSTRAIEVDLAALKERAAERRVFMLNTRGYNYARPGTPGALPPGVKPENN